MCFRACFEEVTHVLLDFSVISRSYLCKETIVQSSYTTLCHISVHEIPKGNRVIDLNRAWLLLILGKKTGHF